MRGIKIVVTMYGLPSVSQIVVMHYFMSSNLQNLQSRKFALLKLRLDLKGIKKFAQSHTINKLQI